MKYKIKVTEDQFDLLMDVLKEVTEKDDDYDSIVDLVQLTEHISNNYEEIKDNHES